MAWPVTVPAAAAATAATETTSCDRVRRELALLREALALPEMLLLVVAAAVAVAREERSGGSGLAGQGRQGVWLNGLVVSMGCWFRWFGDFSG